MIAFEDSYLIGVDTAGSGGVDYCICTKCNYEVKIDDSGKYQCGCGK